DVLGEQVGEAVDDAGRLGALGGGDQAQVARGRGDVGVAWQDAEHGEVEGLGDLGGVAWRAGLVEDHAGDVDARVPRGHAVHDGADRARGAGDVDHQHDRGAGQGCQVSRGGEATATHSAVVQAHDPLDHRHVGAAGAV